MLVLVALPPFRGAANDGGDADRGFNPRDGGATPARRRASRGGGGTCAVAPRAAPRAVPGVLRC